MEYGRPVKLPDGRYFLKITNSLLQVNNVKLADSLTGSSITFDVPSSQQGPIDELDASIIAKAKECKQDWFGKELSDEAIQNAFQSSLTDDAISASPARLKGEVVTTAFDSKKEALELQDVKKGSSCDVLLELAGLWFLKKSFGPIWRVVQVRVRGAARPVFAKEYLFKDSPEDEEPDPADYLD
jgi:hypothetical protein